MNKPLRDHDSELRGLLDSIGLRESPMSTSMTAADRARATLELTKIRARTTTPSQPTRRRSVLVLAVAGAMALVAFMWLRPADQPTPAAPEALLFTQPVLAPHTTPATLQAALQSRLADLAQRVSEQPPSASQSSVTASIERWSQAGLTTTSVVLQPAPSNLMTITRNKVAACGGGSCVLVAAAQTFLTYHLNPADQAELWLTVATAPGLRDLGSTRDRSGHPSIGFAVDDQGIRRLLLADPKTGHFRGIETVDLRPATGPRVISYASLTSAD